MRESGCNRPTRLQVTELVASEFFHSKVDSAHCSGNQSAQRMSPEIRPRMQWRLARPCFCPIAGVAFPVATEVTSLTFPFTSLRVPRSTFDWSLLTSTAAPTQIVSDDDKRWYAFGFYKPSDSASPETPENLIVTQGAAGSRTLLCDWDDARRATNYRLRAKVIATGAQVFSELVADSQGIITRPARRHRTGHHRHRPQRRG